MSLAEASSPGASPPDWARAASQDPATHTSRALIAALVSCWTGRRGRRDDQASNVAIARRGALAADHWLFGELHSFDHPGIHLSGSCPSPKAPA